MGISSVVLIKQVKPRLSCVEGIVVLSFGIVALLYQGIRGWP